MMLSEIVGSRNGSHFDYCLVPQLSLCRVSYGCILQLLGELDVNVKTFHQIKYWIISLFGLRRS